MAIITIMKRKYALEFNHSAEGLAGGLKISPERFKQLTKTLGHGTVESSDLDSRTEIYQYVLEHFDPRSLEEFFACGILLGYRDAMWETFKDQEEMKRDFKKMLKQAGEHPLSGILQKEKRYEA